MILLSLGLTVGAFADTHTVYEKADNSSKEIDKVMKDLGRQISDIGVSELVSGSGINTGVIEKSSSVTINSDSKTEKL